MKRPNGYGAVIKLGGKRRKPWAVRVTDMAKGAASANETGQRTRKYTYISYHEKKTDAYQALEEYNKGKTPIDYLGITFKEIWDKWAERNLESGSKSRADAYRAAIKKCEPLFARKITELRLVDLQEIADTYAGISKSSLDNIKIVMSIVFDWAIKNDIIEKDYSKFVEIRPKQTENHIPLTHQQVNDLIALKSPDNTQKMILIYLFTGVRPAELIELKKEDVHLHKQYFFVRKSKTKSGVRMVPIADKILPMFTDLYNAAESDRLFKFTYQTYKERFFKIFPDHTPHDTRSTFISFMAEKDVQLLTIQKIVGHKSGNVTGDVYTKMTLQPLLDAVNKL